MPSSASTGCSKLDRPSSQAPVSIAEDVIDRDRIEEAVQQSWPREDFLSAIEEAKQAIVDGEIFQVVISRRFETECTADPLEVYRMLRSINPSPYMYLYAFEDAEGRPFHVVGSSPEALVNVSDGQVVTHPIAGSRPRGATAEQDQALGQELLADEKERAEHLMLVDLSATTSRRSASRAPWRSPSSWRSSASATSCTCAPTWSGACART